MTERKEFKDLLLKADDVVCTAFIIELRGLVAGCSHSVATELAAHYLDNHPGYEAAAQALRSCL